MVRYYKKAYYKERDLFYIAPTLSFPTPKAYYPYNAGTVYITRDLPSLSAGLFYIFKAIFTYAASLGYIVITSLGYVAAISLGYVITASLGCVIIASLGYIVFISFLS